MIVHSCKKKKIVKILNHFFIRVVLKNPQRPFLVMSEKRSNQKQNNSFGHYRCQYYCYLVLLPGVSLFTQNFRCKNTILNVSTTRGLGTTYTQSLPTKTCRNRILPIIVAGCMPTVALTHLIHEIWLSMSLCEKMKTFPHICSQLMQIKYRAQVQ